MIGRDERVRHLTQDARALGGRDQHARADLADALEHRNHRLQVADVEDGQHQLDVPKVARAVLHARAARPADRLLVRDAEPAVEYAIPDGGALRLLVALVGEHLQLRGAAHLVLREGAELDVRYALAIELLGDELLWPQWHVVRVGLWCHFHGGGKATRAHTRRREPSG